MREYFIKLLQKIKFYFNFAKKETQIMGGSQEDLPDVSPNPSLSTSLILKIFVFLTMVIGGMGAYFKYIADARVTDAVNSGNSKVILIQQTSDMYKLRAELMEHKYDSLQEVINSMYDGKADWYLKQLKVRLSNDNNTIKEVKIRQK